MFDATTTDDRPHRADKAAQPPSPHPDGDGQRSAYVRAVVDGYGSALGEIVARLGPEAVPPSGRPELWDAFDRVERLAAVGKMVLGQPAR